MFHTDSQTAPPCWRRTGEASNGSQTFPLVQPKPLSQRGRCRCSPDLSRPQSSIVTSQWSHGALPMAPSQAHPVEGHRTRHISEAASCKFSEASCGDAKLHQRHLPAVATEPRCFSGSPLRSFPRTATRSPDASMVQKVVDCFPESANPSFLSQMPGRTANNSFCRDESWAPHGSNCGLVQCTLRGDRESCV